MADSFFGRLFDSLFPPRSAPGGASSPQNAAADSSQPTPAQPAAARAAAAATFVPDPAPHKTVLRPFVATEPVRAAQDFRDLLGGDLGLLLDKVPELREKGTREMDGRRVPVVLAVVRGPQGNTRSGIELRLLDKQTRALLDQSRTDRNGVVLLRFPMRSLGVGGALGAHGASGAGAV